MGRPTNIARAGSHSISKIAPSRANLYTFMSCPKHQYPATAILSIKTILLVLE
jgi:hypothetical protein